MSKTNKDQSEIRIIKKKSKHGGGHHGGAWKVAYADFVTAMMAFFLVMWITNMSPTVKAAVAGYFKDPKGFMAAVKAGNAPFDVPGAKPGGKVPGPKANTQDIERTKMNQAKKTIEKIVADTPEFKNLKKHIDIKVTDEGLRIDLLESSQSLFFDAASARVKPDAAHLLAQIATELKKLPNKIILEGHTDNRPLARTDGYSNWELSSDRANSARKVMSDSGMTNLQIAQVRGYAATRPRDTGHPDSFTNRRVSIVVVFKGKEQEQEISMPNIKQ